MQFDGENLAPVSEKRCIGCNQPIHVTASVCPYCQTCQVTSIWRLLGLALKWIGGMIVVICLCLITLQLHEIVKNTLEKARVVDELLGAAEFQIQLGDFAGAWLLVDQALELEPGSADARQLRLKTAMVWTSSISGIEYGNAPKTYARILDPLVPILLSGTSNTDSGVVADVLAQIGWANHLRRLSGREGLKVQRYFEHALRLDPNNAYAHTFWATWCLQAKEQGGCVDPAETAEKHYSAAMQSDRNLDFAVKMRLQTLLSAEPALVIRDLLALTDHLRNSSERLQPSQAYSAFRQIARLYMNSVYPSSAGAKYLDRPKEQLDSKRVLSALTWLFDQIEQNDQKELNLFYLALRARLLDLAGEDKKALAAYRATRAKLRGSGRAELYFDLQTGIDRALLRLMGLRRGTIGLQWRHVDVFRARSLGLSQPKGYLVESVLPDSAAQAAGLKAGDIILEIGGMFVDSPNFYQAIGTAMPKEGDKLEVKFLRGDTENTVEVVLSPHSENVASQIDRYEEHYLLAYLVDRALYGSLPLQIHHDSLWIATLMGELRNVFGIAADVNGAVILEVDDHGSSSYWKPGRVVTEIAGKPIDTANQVLELVEDAKEVGRTHLPMTVLDNGRRNAISVTLVR